MKRLDLLTFLVFTMVLAGCGLAPAKLLLQPTSAVTPVYQTVAAHLTQAVTASAVLPVDPGAGSSIVLSPTRTATASSPVDTPYAVEGDTAVGGAIACDLISPGLPIDVTIPDGVQFRSGDSFSKTWRLVNSGSCAWTSDYQVVWFSGQPLGVTEQQAFTTEVQPGQSVDITVDMVAPNQPGAYRSNWKLRNTHGHLFGLGPNGDAPFWVQIEVIDSTTPTADTEPTEAPTLAVYASGVANLVANDGIDLDTGKLNRDTDDDLRYQLTPQGKPQFAPENGAKLATFGKQEPTEQDCQTATLGIGPIMLAGVEDGIYICYRTSQGLPGFAHVAKPFEEDTLISLDYVTWTVP